MSSKAITTRPDHGRRPDAWKPPTETSPSATRDSEPFWARVVGVLGLALLVLGGVSLMVNSYWRASLVGPGWAAFLVLLGLGGLLFHSASESDPQFRRAYMVLGYLWVLTGVLASLLPIGGPVGAQFLPYGLLCLLLGLLFLMAYARNEADSTNRDYASFVLGGGGAIMALAGFLGGLYESAFLFPYGVVLIALGLVYLWAFLGLRGTLEDLGYKTALGVGLIGAAAVLLAVVRSLPAFLSARGLLAPGYTSYFMPNGLVILAGGLAYLALAVGLLSEYPYVVMTRRELAAFFNSPVAYFMLLLFAVVATFQFLIFVLENLWDPSGTMQASPAIAFPEPMIRPYVFSLVSIFCLVFLVPVLTMHLLSEEKRTGTLEMTLTAPQEETTVVLSKFTAALIMFVLTWLPWAVFLVALRVEGKQPFDYQPLLAWFIVLVATGAGFISMGLFFSSLTSNQLMAAVMTFVGMLVLVAVFLIKQNLIGEQSLWHPVFSRISFIDAWWHSLDGKLGLTDLLYHLSVTVFWLFLTVKVLESRKWR